MYIFLRKILDFDSSDIFCLHGNAPPPKKKKNTKNKQTRVMLNAELPSAARSIYIQRVETVKQLWPWSSLGITLQNNRNLNQVVLHLLSKFGDPNLNVVMSYRADKLQVENWVKFDF